MRPADPKKLAAVHALVLASLTAVTFALYFQVRGHQFLRFDDEKNIVANPVVTGGLSLDGVVEALTEPGPDALWYPLTWISFQVDRELHGLSPGGVLLGNVLLHIASSLLLYWVVWRMTGAVGASAFVAAVFAWHPLHVESVAWAFERKDALSGFFWMLTLLLYVRSCERPGPGRGALVAIAYGLGLLAKPSLTTLPFALLLLDYWPLGRLAGEGRALAARPLLRALREKWLLFALAAAVAGITLMTQPTSGLRGQLDLDVRLANALESYVWYVVKTFWPSGLAIFYPHPLEDVNPLRALGCGIGLALVTLQAFRSAVARPYLIVGWLWYVGNLVPVIGIVQVGSQAHADRYTYIPMIGITLALAFGAIDWAGGRPRRQRALAAAGVASCAALAWVAFQQVGTWRNEETVFRRALAVTGPNALAHRQLGRARHRVGDLPGAAEHYDRALAIEPGFKEVQLEYGDVLRALGQVSQAREHYALALRLAEFEGDDAFAAVVRERLAPPRGAAPAP